MISTTWLDVFYPDARGRMRKVSLHKNYVGKSYPIEYGGVAHTIEEELDLTVPIPWEADISFTFGKLKLPNGRDSPLDLRKTVFELERKAGGSFWVHTAFRFYLLDYLTLENSGNAYVLNFDTREEREYPIAEKHIQPFDAYYGVRTDIAQSISYPLAEVVSHGHGDAPSLQEIRFNTPSFLSACDGYMTAKWITANLAVIRGFAFSFHPSLFGEGKCYIELAFDLRDKEGNSLFFPGNKVSEKAKYFVSGIRARMPFILALSVTNKKSFEAAMKRNLIEIDERKKVVVFRGIDNTSNIYLAVAAMLHAGVEGMEKRRAVEKEKIMINSSDELLEMKDEVVEFAKKFASKELLSMYFEEVEKEKRKLKNESVANYYYSVFL